MDGQAFLPHARDLLRAAERAAASVRPGGQALRVDVISRRIAPARLLADFHRAHPGPPLEVVRLYDTRAAIGAVQDGVVDASFRAVTRPARQLPAGIAASPDLASLVGEQTHLIWPADWDLRRIPLRDPVPVYPHSLIWRRDNPHPALRALREHLAASRADGASQNIWVPEWARR